jgi:protein phosphatase
MVADGMGGAVAGDLASRLAVEHASHGEGTPAERVREGNNAILEEARRRPHLAGMGTTLTLAELAPDRRMRMAHVGDSRAYLLRDGELRLLTQDHTMVAEFVASGKLSPLEALGHPQRSVLTRALGISESIDVDELELELRPADRLLICSDGLPSMVDDADIANGLGAGSPEEAVWRLIEMANMAGGFDNITALVVEVEP